MELQAGLPIYDNVALAELYQRHTYTLLNFIRRYATTREDAEDILLEVFLAALEHGSLAKLNHGEQLAWLRRVAHNKCADVYRRMQRQRIVPLESVAETLYADEELTPEWMAISAEEHARLRAHLAQLSEQQQAALRLRFADDLRCREIAKRLNKNEGAVRMLLSRTLNLLRGTYEKQEQGVNQDE